MGNNTRFQVRPNLRLRQKNKQIHKLQKLVDELIEEKELLLKQIKYLKNGTI